MNRSEYRNSGEKTKKEDQHEPHKRFHGILITKKTKQDMWKMQVL